MNLYGVDLNLFDLGFVDDPIFSRNYREREDEEDNLLKLSNSILRNIKINENPPPRRHDGTSPLPLGMDWSPPPRNWNGPTTIWPHDFHTGWSYCVTVPSWSTFSESENSEPVVFYRVQVGLQSPEGVTTTRGVLRRFNEFLKLSVDLRRSFRKKKFPPTPPKGLLRMNSRKLFEERRCSLEEWMAKILSDIDISRSVHVACFLELEAAARSSFYETTSHYAPEFSPETFNVSDHELTSSREAEATMNEASHGNDNGASNTDRIESRSALKISPISVTHSEADKRTSSEYSGSVETSESPDVSSSSDLHFSNNTVVVSPTDEKNDTEYLKQAILVEKERYTQVQWDMEELSRKCIELELELKSEQDKKAHVEATNIKILEENEALRKELDSTKEVLKNLKKCHEDSDLKSKSDFRLLVKEVKTLRSSQSELSQELERLAKEKTDLERFSSEESRESDSAS